MALQSAWLLSQVNSHKSKVVEFERKVILQVEDIWRLEKMGLARVVEGIRQALGHVVKEGTTSAPKVNMSGRCIWWNRGYCREQEACIFSHECEDCTEHLKSGGCTNRGGQLR